MCQEWQSQPNSISLKLNFIKHRPAGRPSLYANKRRRRNYSFKSVGTHEQEVTTNAVLNLISIK